MELIAENGTKLLINGNTIEIFGDIYIKAEAQAVFYDKYSNFDYAITKEIKIYLIMSMEDYCTSLYKSIGDKLWVL